MLNKNIRSIINHYVAKINVSITRSCRTSTLSVLMKHAHAYSHFWQSLHPRTSTSFAAQDWPARSPDLSPLTTSGGGTGKVWYMTTSGGGTGKVWYMTTSGGGTGKIWYMTTSGGGTDKVWYMTTSGGGILIKCS